MFAPFRGHDGRSGPVIGPTSPGVTPTGPAAKPDLGECCSCQDDDRAGRLVPPQILAEQRTAVAVADLDAGTRRYTLEDGRTLTVLAGGAMVNLAAGNGNPIETMDLGLTLQLRSLAHLASATPALPPGRHPVPPEIDHAVAEAMLRRLAPQRAPLTAVPSRAM